MHPTLVILPLGAFLFVRSTPPADTLPKTIALVVQAAAFVMLWAVNVTCCGQSFWPTGIVLYAIAAVNAAKLAPAYRWLPAGLLWAWYGVTHAECACPALWMPPYFVILATFFVAYRS